MDFLSFVLGFIAASIVYGLLALWAVRAPVYDENEMPQKYGSEFPEEK